MLMSKAFWAGFILAYGIAFFLPPSKLMGKGKG